jgi:hypothetical protein
MGQVEPTQPTDRAPAEAAPSRARDAEPALADPAAAAGPAGEPPAPEPETAARPALVDAANAAGEQPAPPAAQDRGGSGRSPRDMAISLLVLLIPIALLLAFYRGFLGGDQPATVNPGPALEQARAAQAFPVAEPAGLSSDWKPVSATYRSADGGSSLRIGYVTPEGRGVQLVQSNVPPERLLPAELTDKGQPQGPTVVAGRNWQRYTARGNEQALVLLEPERTVIVVGDARENELRQLAGSLR